jgi:hypothetical protein
MQFIQVDRKALDVVVVNTPLPYKFSVPTKLKKLRWHLSPIEEIIYHDVLYRAIHAEDRREMKRRGETEVGVAYQLIEPEPWMVAIGCLMWEGIAQGLAWDAVKVAVTTALGRLREHKLAPLKIDKEAETQIGFVWEEYASDGRKLHHMFLGIKRKYKLLKEEERKTVSESVIKG